MTQANIVIEHLGAEYFSDPYSVHARLRAQHPVAQVIMPGGTPAWLVTGYAEARAALTDPRLHKLPEAWRPEPDSLLAALDLHMLNLDPPDHDRLRKLVSKAFTPRRSSSSGRGSRPSPRSCLTTCRLGPTSTCWPRSPSRCRSPSSASCSACPWPTGTSSGPGRRRSSRTRSHRRGSRPTPPPWSATSGPCWPPGGASPPTTCCPR